MNAGSMLVLFLAIVSEVVGTVALKASEGFARPDHARGGRIRPDVLPAGTRPQADTAQRRLRHLAGARHRSMWGSWSTGRSWTTSIPCECLTCSSFAGLSVLRTHKSSPPEEHSGGALFSTYCLWRALGVLRGLVAPLGLIPVHHVPPRLYVLWAAVLVLEVVGVLPHIQPYNRRLAFHERAVPVRSGLYGEGSIGVRYEPSPSRSKQGSRCCRSSPSLLELFKGAKGGVYRFSKLSGGLSTSLTRWSHDLPEHGVVRVLPAVVPDRPPNILGHGVEVGDELIHVAGVCLGVLLQGGIEVGNVGIVVFFVVEVHGLFVYVGL